MKRLFLILCSLNFSLSAATVDTNHSAALISPNELSDWQQAQQALTAILSKKSGLAESKVAGTYTVDESYKAAIVRSYHERVPNQLAGDKQWFNVIVDEEKMHQLMLSQRIPIWPERRGMVYVWMVEEHVDQPLAYAGDGSEAVYWLKKWLDVMGVPSQFYDADAEDLLTFRPQDVRYLNPDLIDYIQAENDINMTLLVFVKHSSNGYSYRFGLSESEKSAVIKSLQFLDLAVGMKSLAGNVQNIMADEQRLYAEEFNNSTIAVTINDINDANNILKLMNYLDQHVLIDEYQINQLKSKQLNIMMRIKVLPETFIKFVENEGFLRHQPLGIGRSLLFQWVQ
ncbi:hypothetical protein MNBD_GAMMA02-821 [hydrothermal vent metagenome]|uniref:DUF2066 domain-containing protein n=1 Tax=hydrothermal vent metagenome TaxID=652676 RepID=A0A3B0WJS3_9ZZZZ